VVRLCLLYHGRSQHQRDPARQPAGSFTRHSLAFIKAAFFRAAWTSGRDTGAFPVLNALVASLILSSPWLYVHLPLIFKVGSSQSKTVFLSYAIGMMATTILFTFLYNHTRGSLLLVWILHASTNTWTQIFSINSSAPNPLLDWMLTGVLVTLAVIVVMVYGAKSLSRTNTRITE
jgi:hypothetical protein